VPFRDAHEAVGRAVRLAESRGVPLDRLGAVDWNAIHAGLGDSLGDLFDPARALGRRSAFGGTAPQRLEEAIEEASRQIAADCGPAAGREGSA
jgi:argininosuccinate lyase